MLIYFIRIQKLTLVRRGTPSWTDHLSLHCTLSALSRGKFKMHAITSPDQSRLGPKERIISTYRGAAAGRIT